LERPRNNRGGLCNKFYAELDFAADRHALSLFLTATSDGQISYKDAMEMDADDLISSFKFYEELNKRKDKGVSFDAIKKAMQ
jgi:hypothetical protein